MELKFTIRIICFALIIALRVLYAATIYSKCKCDNKSIRNTLIYLSLPFPIITGIICIIKYKKSIKDNFIILITLIFTLASVIAISCSLSAFNDYTKYYDKDGKAYSSPSDVIFTDREGNKYTFDYDKTFYDYLYINSTDECLNADYCYLDSEGYLCYDYDMSITVKDETCCVDEGGSLYYPAKFTTFNKDGTIKYHFNIGNFRYDRLGNAYTYDNVPYFDAEGNKYLYSYDSGTQKGTYTNISTNEAFDNEYCFVDENGCFIYDKDHSFVKKNDEERNRAYTAPTEKHIIGHQAFLGIKKVICLMHLVKLSRSI